MKLFIDLFPRSFSPETDKICTAEELLFLLEENDDPISDADVVYIPPEVDELTDDEDIDDNVIQGDSTRSVETPPSTP